MRGVRNDFMLVLPPALRRSKQSYGMSAAIEHGENVNAARSLETPPVAGKLVAPLGTARASSCFQPMLLCRKLPTRYSYLLCCPLPRC